ncbi:hypothetical protein GCM10022224_068680 [Nonomuraea antimicrobica]|uniref:Phage integrase family protein n=1 Tax=Nonomuraea antimicrobica TaxID=561173 RepID=A0ABP7CRN3_9ACTN
MERIGHGSVRAALVYWRSTAEADRRIADGMNAKTANNPDGSSNAHSRACKWHAGPVSVIEDGLSSQMGGTGPTGEQGRSPDHPEAESLLEAYSSDHFVPPAP